MITTLITVSGDPAPYYWTRDAFQQAAELGVFHDQKVELVEGQVLQMTPAGTRHTTIVGKVAEALRAAFGEGHVIRVQSPLAILEHSQPEPDVAVVRGGFDDFEEHHPDRAELVIEVSDTSLRYDRSRKAKIYAAAKLPEYWIVNLNADQIEVHRQPTEEAGYAEKFVVKKEGRLAPLGAPQAILEAEKLLPRRGLRLDD